MYSYLKHHERYFLDRLQKEDDLLELYSYHNLQIQWLQHERLIHLLVTLFTAALSMTFALASMLMENLLLFLLFLITAVLLIFYIIHYYRLENGVQHWYDLSNELHEKLKEQSGV